VKKSLLARVVVYGEAPKPEDSPKYEELALKVEEEPADRRSYIWITPKYSTKNWQTLKSDVRSLLFMTYDYNTSYY
jgi:hypothetical protein